MSTDYSRALLTIVHDGVASITEMARVVGCSKSHMRNVVSQGCEKELSLEKAETLSKWLCDVKEEARQVDGLNDVADGCHGMTGVEGEAYFPVADCEWENDDDLSPEHLRLCDYITNAQDAMGEGNRDEADHWMQKAKGMVEAMHRDAATPAD